jgi:TPR repeat protein
MDDVFRSESKFDDLDQSLKHRLSGGTDNTTAKRGPSEINRIERRLGWLALTRNSLAEALQHFNAALNAVPDDGYSLWERGMCYDLLSRPELAYSDYAAYLQTRDFRNETDNYRYREVVDFKKYCNKDYFAAEACRGSAGIWPTSLLPLKVYIPSGKGPNSFDPVARAEILKCLDEWCQTLPTVLSYKLVDSEEQARLTFARVQSSYMLEDSGHYDGMTHIQMEPNNGWGPNIFKIANIRFVDYDFRHISEDKIARIHSLYLHEIGHALGLRTHSTNADDVMFSTCKVKHLSPRDVATMRKLYAPNLAPVIKSTVLSLAGKGCTYALYGEAMHEIVAPGAERNWPHAIVLLQSAYEQHLPDAATQIGLMYRKGDRTLPRDYRQALVWFEKAINAGDVSANISVGDLYEYGLDVIKDPVKAVNYYREAAKKGNIVAERKMGYAYRNGFGVEQDYFQSFQWFSKAATQNDSDAQRMLGDAYYRGSGVKQDSFKAFTWYQRAANNDDSRAQYSLGYLYQFGPSVPIDLDKAKFWYRKAVAQGNTDAARQLNAIP